MDGAPRRIAPSEITAASARALTASRSGESRHTSNAENRSKGTSISRRPWWNGARESRTRSSRARTNSPDQTNTLTPSGWPRKRKSPAMPSKSASARSTRPTRVSLFTKKLFNQLRLRHLRHATDQTVCERCQVVRSHPALLVLARASQRALGWLNPDQVVMAPAQPESDFVGRVELAGLEPATSWVRFTRWSSPRGATLVCVAQPCAARSETCAARHHP